MDLLSIDSLSDETIAGILDRGELYFTGNRGRRANGRLHGRVIFNVFYENSTRTAMSFATAAHRLGASAIALSVERSSVMKGETLEDTARTLNAMRPDALVIRHVYIERRMVPLNIYLRDATPQQVEHAVVEYGNAIKDLVSANIFPGDMLWKNFGVTRHGKVVFYDYDEIEYMTDCNFRKVPEPHNEEEAMSGEVWYRVGPKDVFPETFEPFLLGNAAIRDVFMRHHADLLDAAFWQGHKERILAGYVHDVFPYEAQRRFEHRRRQGSATPAASAPEPVSR